MLSCGLHQTKKEMIPMDYSIMSNNGHFEAYINGKFYCIADTYLMAAAKVETKRMEIRNESRNHKCVGLYV
jgi:uncharacterized protein YxjI